MRSHFLFIWFLIHKKSPKIIEHRKMGFFFFFHKHINALCSSSFKLYIQFILSFTVLQFLLLLQNLSIYQASMHGMGRHQQTEKLILHIEKNVWKVSSLSPECRLVWNSPVLMPPKSKLDYFLMKEWQARHYLHSDIHTCKTGI